MCHELLFCFPELMLLFLRHPYFLLYPSRWLPLALIKFTHAYCIISWRVAADAGLLCFNLSGLRLFSQPFRRLNFTSTYERFCIHSFGTKEIRQTSRSLLILCWREIHLFFWFISPFIFKILFKNNMTTSLKQIVTHK